MQDEFVWVLDGELVLVTDAGEELMTPGMSAGFPAGEPDGQAGPQTRAAVKSFQKEAGLPPDGYPDGAVFDAILATTKETEATP